MIHSVCQRPSTHPWLIPSLLSAVTMVAFTAIALGAIKLHYNQLLPFSRKVAIALVVSGSALSTAALAALLYKKMWAPPADIECIIFENGDQTFYIYTQRFRLVSATERFEPGCYQFSFLENGQLCVNACATIGQKMAYSGIQKSPQQFQFTFHPEEQIDDSWIVRNILFALGD